MSIRQKQMFLKRALRHRTGQFLSKTPLVPRLFGKRRGWRTDRGVILGSLRLSRSDALPFPQTAVSRKLTQQ
jgi:hypothetical protein